MSVIKWMSRWTGMCPENCKGRYSSDAINYTWRSWWRVHFVSYALYASAIDHPMNVPFKFRNMWVLWVFARKLVVSQRYIIILSDTIDINKRVMKTMSIFADFTTIPIGKHYQNTLVIEWFVSPPFLLQLAPPPHDPIWDQIYRLPCHMCEISW